MTLKAEAKVKAWTLEAKTIANEYISYGQDQGQNSWVQGQFQGQIWLTI